MAPAVFNVMASGDAASGLGLLARHGVASCGDDGISISGENINA